MAILPHHLLQCVSIPLHHLLVERPPRFRGAHGPDSEAGRHRLGVQLQRVGHIGDALQQEDRLLRCACVGIRRGTFQQFRQWPRMVGNGSQRVNVTLSISQGPEAATVRHSRPQYSITYTADSQPVRSHSEPV